MTETQKRIQAYKKALPGMKERVSAVALLLVVSIAMMTSATFAWMTLSRSPEVSSIATTVTTNGNLEIALSGTDGEEPDETTVNDGNWDPDGGQDVLKSNLTWGNLVNLSDSRYGLSEIALRPASLNDRTLDTSPMYAVQYGADGRVLGYLYDFAYTNYAIDPETGGAAFVPEDQINYGVRAISTVTYKDFQGDALLVRMLEEIDATLITAKGNFQKIYDTDPKVGGQTATNHMRTVGNLVGIHVDYTLNGGSPDCQNEMEGLHALMVDFLSCLEECGEIIVDAANLCLFSGNRTQFNDDPYTFEDLIDGTLTNESLSTACGKDIELECLDYFMDTWRKMAGYDCQIQTYSTLPSYSSSYANVWGNKNAVRGAYEVIDAKYNQYKQNVQDNKDTTVPYDNWMIMAIDLMCDMDSATIRAEGHQDYTPAQLLQLKSDLNISELRPFLGDGPFYATIHDGALKDLDQMLDCGMYVESSSDIRIVASVSVPVIGNMNIDMQPNISTSLDESPILVTDIATSKTVATTGSGNSNYKGEPSAAETYAMVMDLWVRTNSDNALLILEGEPVWKEKIALNENNEEMGALYSCTLTNAETNAEETVYVYKKDGALYFDMTSEALTAEQQTEAEQTLAVVYEEKPVGYEGVNRVWDELDDPTNPVYEQIPDGSIVATQGSGSCYIFYPESMEDQGQALKLLSAMRVAFVDEHGKLLARADMDTSLAVEDSGRVIVPLQLRPNDPITVNGVTEDHYITLLEKNKATRITAIVYLEGSNLSNSDVLAASSITGQLNIQFGTSEMEMEPMKDQDVMNEHYELDFVQNIFEFDEKATDWNIDLSLEVFGNQPTSIKGNFVSIINATQGVRQDEFTMIYNEDTKVWEAHRYVLNEDGKTGRWVKGVPFAGPGNYQLRSLTINGVDYLLDEDNIVKVTIPGIAISSVTWLRDPGKASMNVLTAAKQVAENMSLTLNFNSDEISDYPSVQGVLLGDTGQNVTVNFTPNSSGVYTGTANFGTSGTYKMTYVYVDGVITALPEHLYREITLQMGLQAKIGYTSVLLEDPDKDNPLTAEQKAEILKMQSAPGAQNCMYVYNGEAPLTMKVWCTVQDDQDNFLTGLDDPLLYYDTGSVAVKAEDDLEWNAETKRYEGTFDLNQKYGVLNFRYLDLGGGNIITTASSAFTITAIPPDPMEYVGMATGHQDLVVDLSATSRTISLALKNASAATLDITLRSPKDGEVTVTGVTRAAGQNGEDLFTVNVNDIKSGITQHDGTWTIVKARASSVFYNGTFYSGGESADNWLDLTPFIEAEAERQDNPEVISTEFVTQVKVVVSSASAKDGVIEFKDPVAIGTEVQLADNEFVVSFLAYNDEPIVNYTGDLSVSATGSYTWQKATDSIIQSVSDTPATVGITGSDANGTTPKITKENPTLVLNVDPFTADGLYKLGQLTVKLGEKEYTLTGLPDVKMKWKAPTVTVKAITPTGSNPAKITYTTKSLSWGRGTEPTFTATGNQTSSRTDYAATVYAVATADNSTQRHGGFTRPTLTLTVAGVDSSSAVSLTLPAGSADAITFSRTGNGDMTKTLGKVDQIKSWTSNFVLTHTLSAYYGHGTQTIRTMKMVRDGITFEITLGNPITIINPSSVNQ